MVKILLSIFFFVILNSNTYAFGPNPNPPLKQVQPHIKNLDIRLSESDFLKKEYLKFKLNEVEFSYKIIRSDGVDSDDYNLGVALYKISQNPAWVFTKVSTSEIQGIKLFSIKFETRKELKQIGQSTDATLHFALGNGIAKIISIDSGFHKIEGLEAYLGLIALINTTKSH
jgi:hypothetical protein